MVHRSKKRKHVEEDVIPHGENDRDGKIRARERKCQQLQEENMKLKQMLHDLRRERESDRQRQTEMEAERLKELEASRDREARLWNLVESLGNVSS
jgi:hypothetical protein